MTRSIFDPTGPNPERSGSTFLGPDADNRSRMPESAVDGVAGPEGGVEDETIVEFDSTGKPIDPAAVKPPDDSVEG